MTSLVQFEIVLGLLTFIVVLSAIAQRLRIPPAVVFTLGGMGLAVIPQVPAISIPSNLILILFLPPLLQASALLTVWRDFRSQLTPILVLAVGAVAFTTFVVGWVAKLVVPGLPWAACFALGAIVSPPDAVAAKAILQTLRLPRRIVVLLEGESLLNDATSLILYRFAVAAALSGSFSISGAVGEFAWLVIGGVGIGIGFGYIADTVFRRMRDAHLLILCSFLVGWASYIVSERLHVSGVLAVVSCGLLLGWRQHETLNAAVRSQAKAVWEIVVFVLEALVFVLIGLALRGILDRAGGTNEFEQVGLPLSIAITAVVILSRFIWVYPAVYLPWLFPAARRRAARPPLSVPLTLSWSGMRGVVSLAAVLALPEAFPGRDLILEATFGVIAATVLLQGATLGPLVRILDIAKLVEPDDTLSMELARAHMFEASADWLESKLDAGTNDVAHPLLVEQYRSRASAATRYLSDTEDLLTARRVHFETALNAVGHSRQVLISLHRSGKIHDTVLHAIGAELDHEELLLRRLAGLEVNDH